MMLRGSIRRIRRELVSISLLSANDIGMALLMRGSRWCIGLEEEG